MQQRNFWGIAIPRFLADPMWGTLSFWLPLYLNKVRGWDLKHIAMFAWMPFLAADFGCIFGGMLSAALQKHKGVSRDQCAPHRLHCRRVPDDERGVRRACHKPLRCYRCCSALPASPTRHSQSQ